MWFARILLGLALAMGAVSARASDNIYADDLGKCFVAKTSDADKIGLAQWIFVTMAAHPAVEKLAKFSAAEHAVHDRFMAQTVDRLLTVDCRSEAVAALKYEGPVSLQGSFGVLGQVAMKTLTSEPTVDQAFGHFAEYLDDEKLKSVFTEAGLKPPPTKTPDKAAAGK